VNVGEIAGAPPYQWIESKPGGEARDQGASQALVSLSPERKMRIQIRRRDGILTSAAKIGIERRLALALGRFGERIGTVTVNLWANGSSAERRCQINVSLTPARKVTVEHRDPDLLIATARAAQQVRRAIARVLELEREVEHRLLPAGPVLQAVTARRKAIGARMRVMEVAAAQRRPPDALDRAGKAPVAPPLAAADRPGKRGVSSGASPDRRPRGTRSPGRR
jgi:hypothetical protein